MYCSRTKPYILLTDHVILIDYINKSNHERDRGSSNLVLHKRMVLLLSPRTDKEGRPPTRHDCAQGERAREVAKKIMI